MSQILEGVWDERRIRDAALRLRPHGGLAWLDADGVSDAGRRLFLGAAPVETLRIPWGDDALAALLAIAGGSDSRPRWIGYVAYDAFWARSQAEPRMARDERWPVLLLHRYDALIEVDLPLARARLLADDRAAADRAMGRLASPPSPVGPVRVAELPFQPSAAPERRLRRRSYKILYVNF